MIRLGSRAALVLTVTAAFASGATLIRNATLLTVSDGVVENGSMLVDGGKIRAIGPDVDAPAGAAVVDGTGLFVLPGIVDAHAHIAIDATNELTVPVSSMVSMVDVLRPGDVSIDRALSGGVTTANILHGSGNPIGGQCVVIKLRPDADAQGLIFEGAKPGIKFALGENPKNVSRSPFHPDSRQGVNDVIREAFIRARAYRAEWDKYEREKAAGRRALPPRRDLQLDPLVEVLTGERLVHAHCYRQDEILALLRLAEQNDFKIRTLQHVLEGYKVAPEIAAHGAGASTFSDWWAYKVEAVDAIPHNAALMTRAGVLVSINSDSVSTAGRDGSEEIRHLNREAAKTVKWGGLSDEEALALITLNPAKQLMIDDRVGSLEVGKDGDFSVWDAHPLSSYAKVLKTFVDGEEVFDRERALEEHRERAQRKKALLAERKPAKRDESEEEEEVKP